MTTNTNTNPSIDAATGGVLFHLAALHGHGWVRPAYWRHLQGAEVNFDAVLAAHGWEATAKVIAERMDKDESDPLGYPGIYPPTAAGHTTESKRTRWSVRFASGWIPWVRIEVQRPSGIGLGDDDGYAVVTANYQAGDEAAGRSPVVELLVDPRADEGAERRHLAAMAQCLSGLPGCEEMGTTEALALHLDTVALVTDPMGVGFWLRIDQERRAAELVEGLQQAFGPVTKEDLQRVFNHSCNSLPEDQVVRDRFAGWLVRAAGRRFCRVKLETSRPAPGHG